MKRTLSISSPIPELREAVVRVISHYAESLEPLSDIARRENMTQALVFAVLADQTDLVPHWQLAGRIRAQAMADAALKASEPTRHDWTVDRWGRYSGNSGLLARAALRSKTLLTLAGKLDPQRFGDRVEEREEKSSTTLVIGSPEQAAQVYHERQRMLTNEHE